MSFINELLHNPNSSYDFFNFAGIILSCIASIFIFRAQTANSFIKERHDKLIFPLFNVLESFLYQEANEDVICKALDIINKNKQLADGKLLKVIYWYQRNPNHKNYVSLCSYIDNAYDKSCKALHLELRPFEYRFARRQYKNKLHLYLFLGKCLFSYAVSWIVFFLATAFLVNLYLIIFDLTNDIERLILFLGILAFCWFSLKRLLAQD